MWEEEWEEENDDEYDSKDGVSVDRGQDEANFAARRSIIKRRRLKFITKAGTCFLVMVERCFHPE